MEQLLKKQLRARCAYASCVTSCVPSFHHDDAWYFLTYGRMNAFFLMLACIQKLHGRLLVLYRGSVIP
jgi:hypothetical protein